MSVGSGLGITNSGVLNTNVTLTVGDDDIIPDTSNAYDLGSTSNRWRNIYTTDLQLSNMEREVGNEVDGTRGNWTLQEGKDDLYIINRLNGKHYKINLEEVK